MMNTRIKKWLEGPYDPETKAELRRLIALEPKKLNDAFFKDLSFGTGGLRAIMGVGTNRLNIYTIRMATQGLANYLNKLPQEKHKVFIGYDVRNHSREFAEETAKVFAGNGIEALLSKTICPTPLVSFACRYYECSAAIMITASHNPPEYNGYKVYWNDGCQIVAPHDAEIIKEVNKVKDPSKVKLKKEFTEVEDELDIAYLSELKKLQMRPELAEVPLKIIYSNLHGTGIRLIPKALKEWGYTKLSFVEMQKKLDGNFTYTPSPNPEDEKALEMGTEQLIREKADIFIATDPDADRIGLVANGVRFTGNQIACLCIHHICKTLSMKNELPSNAAFIKSIVTTELFRKIAENFNAKCIDVLTGFKYIGEQIGVWENSFGGYQFIFGAEESYGYLMGTFVRDKDAISTACLIAEMAASCKKENITLLDQLYRIYQQYGIHRASLINIAFSDSKEGMEKRNNLMKTFRKNPPSQIGNQKVAKVEDFINGIDTLPPSDVLRFWLQDGSKLVIRPSGTEPKMKIYAEVTSSNKNIQIGIEECDQKLKSLIESFKSLTSI